MKTLTALLFFLLITQFTAALADGLPDFNSCRDLPVQKRDECLLGLSHSSLEALTGGQKAHSYKHISLVTLRDGMLADSDNYTDVGQI